MGTKNNPGKFDCYEKAGPDEPMFVLLARDPDAYWAVGKWIEKKRARGGESEEKLAEAQATMLAMVDWQKGNR